MTARRTSRLIVSRTEIAALVSMTMGREAAVPIRYASRFGRLPRHATVPETAWHPTTQLDTQTRRGTTSENLRGSAEDRRRRKRYLLDTWGDGTAAPCVFCKVALTYDTVTVDRYPIPGRLGGRYTRDNIRPACGPCNSEDQGRAGVLASTSGGGSDHV